MSIPQPKKKLQDPAIKRQTPKKTSDCDASGGPEANSPTDLRSAGFCTSQVVPEFVNSGNYLNSNGFFMLVVEFQSITTKTNGKMRLNKAYVSQLL